MTGLERTLHGNEILPPEKSETLFSQIHISNEDTMTGHTPLAVVRGSQAPVDRRRGLTTVGIVNDTARIRSYKRLLLSLESGSILTSGVAAVMHEFQRL